jgi:hypothetical protein
VTHRARAPAALCLTTAALLLAACSQSDVREQAEGLASSAAASASSQAVAAVRDKVCQIAADSNISPQEVETLKGLVEAAQAAGVGDRVLDPARKIADSGDQVPADAVEQLQQACRPTS